MSNINQSKAFEPFSEQEIEIRRTLVYEAPHELWPDEAMRVEEDRRWLATTAALRQSRDEATLAATQAIGELHDARAEIDRLQGLLAKSQANRRTQRKRAQRANKKLRTSLTSREDS